MQVKLGDLRKVIREEMEYAQAINEIFGKKQDFGGMLDQIVQHLFNINKEVEEAHKLAPMGPAKAIVAGIHSDLFNKVAEIRKYVEQLKGMAKGAKAA
jgi:hypothetical protein